MATNSNLPHFGDFANPKDYFKAYCECMNYKLMSMETCGNNMFLVEYYMKDDDACSFVLEYIDDLMEDTIILGEASATEPTEVCALRLVYENYVLLHGMQKKRIAKLKEAFNGDKPMNN